MPKIRPEQGRVRRPEARRDRRRPRRRGPRGGMRGQGRAAEASAAPPARTGPDATPVRRPGHLTAAPAPPARRAGKRSPARPESGRNVARARGPEGSGAESAGGGGGGLKAEPSERGGNCEREPGGHIAGSEATGAETPGGEAVRPLTEAELRPRPKSRAELRDQHGKRGGARKGNTSPSSCPGAPSRKERFAGFPTASKRRSPPPAAVTPRFSRLCAGAPERGGARSEDVARPANLRIHLWVARAPFCEEEYK